MPTEVPLLNAPQQSLTVILGDQETALKVWRQPSDGHWYVTIEAPPGTAIAVGRKLVPNVGVLGLTTRPFLGDLAPFGPDGDIGKEPWGETHKLIWIEP